MARGSTWVTRGSSRPKTRARGRGAAGGSRRRHGALARLATVLAALPPALAVALPSPTATAAPAPATAATSYTNPLTPLDTPDPSVIRVGDTYYMYSTGDSINRITELSTTTLAQWPQKYGYTKDALPTVGVWATDKGGKAPWAPDVIQVGTMFYMFYAAYDPSVKHYCIGVATSTTPQGPFVDSTLGPIVCQTTLGGSIDPSAYYGATGNMFLTWKSNDGTSTLPATLWAAELSLSAGTARVVGSMVDLVNQDQRWESTIENPFMELDHGQYYLLYSGGLYTSATYAIGYALCSGPLGPCRTPFDHPIFSTSGSVAGPGGPSVFTNESGQLWLAYHAWTAPTIGYKNHPNAARSLRIDPFCTPGGLVDVPGPTTSATSLSPSCPTVNNEGYQLVASDGGVFNFATPFHGSMGGQHLDAPIVGTAPDPATGGYWEVASDGGIFSFTATFFGSMGGQPLVAPIVGMASTSDGKGYWEVASDGGIFSFGDAHFYGSMGGQPLVAPIVAIAVDQWTGGYWEVASDGGIFSYDAGYFGSMGGKPLDSPIVGMAPAVGGLGYWMVAADGGIFSFGAATFLGSMGGKPLNSPIVGMAADGFGEGYWLFAADGGIFSYGASGFAGSAASEPLVSPVVGGFAP